jgi:hypothetical protein
MENTSVGLCVRACCRRWREQVRWSSISSAISIARTGPRARHFPAGFAFLSPEKLEDIYIAAGLLMVLPALAIRLMSRGRAA